jgi:hypothetical protein
VRVIPTDKAASSPVVTAALQVEPQPANIAPASQPQQAATAPTPQPSAETSFARPSAIGAARVDTPAPPRATAVPTERPAATNIPRGTVNRAAAKEANAIAAAAKRDAKRTKPEDKSVRAVRIRDPQDQDKALEQRNAPEGFAVVRSHTLPDGRRVTVYREVRGDDGLRAREDGARPRRVPAPFSGSDDDDDD